MHDPASFMAPTYPVERPTYTGPLRVLKVAGVWTLTAGSTHTDAREGLTGLGPAISRRHA